MIYTRRFISNFIISNTKEIFLRTNVALWKLVRMFIFSMYRNRQYLQPTLSLIDHETTVVDEVENAWIRFYHWFVSVKQVAMIYQLQIE